MNFCLYYVAVWSLELLLYSFGWSNINTSLDTGLLLILITTVIFSLFLGIRYRKLFKFKFVDLKKCQPKKGPLICIVLTYVVEFIYCRQIPLLSILTGSSEYTSYTGLPVIHVLVVTYASFYSYYCYYLFECTNDKEYLRHVIVIAGLHLLVFSRVSLIVLLFEIIAIKIAKKGGLVKIFRPKRFIALMIVLVLVLYSFGILGNLRSGRAWNDTSVINAIGQYNDKYPSFLSDHFKWAYTYITSPLANLNNGFIKNGVKLDAKNYAISFFPDFLSKRLFPNYLSSIPDSRTVGDLNAVSGYYFFYYFGGFLGALIMYLILVGGSIFILKYIKFPEGQYYTFLMVATGMIVFLFFYNVIYLSQCSFVMTYPLLSALFKRVKVRIM